ncbi:MAG TPA: hypothetical protein VMV34_04175 [Terriglobia bacterium]|nr:hypothetical protein [Terriglobia bacterium]
MQRQAWIKGLLALAVLICVGAPRANAEGKRDAKAVEIAQAMMQAMGGAQGWDSVHFVRFDFKVIASGKVVVNRHHLWDKNTGRYRLETKTKDGREEVVLFNAGTKEGRVYIGGKQVEGAEAAEALKDAYAAYINDMYWLAEPWKWLDSGVNLKYAGARKRGQETYDVVQLTFGHVGLTPGDEYWAYVSRKSHLMAHWEYRLQSGQKGSWDWEYGDYGGIKLAKNHVSTDKKTEINMGDVQVLSTVDDAFFTDPAHMLSDLK